MISEALIHLDAPQHSIPRLPLQHPLLRINGHVQSLLEILHISQVCARSRIEVDGSAEIHSLCGGDIYLLMRASAW